MYQDRIREIDQGPLREALLLLPARMNSLRARSQLLKTTLQESLGIHRRQLGNGPARGLWQFELGAIHGQVGSKEWGLYIHPMTRDHLRSLCAARGVAFKPTDIYRTLEHDDVLAAGVARLNYWWVSQPLPEINDLWGSWAYYNSTWAPGKPHPKTWPLYHAAVLEYLST